MATRWGAAIEPLTPATLAGADVIVDALFGAGLSRPLEGMAADVVAAINACGKPVVAVDVPSGLDGTTGTSSGPVVQATRTVTFFRMKPGHLLLPGRTLCGEVRLADIGIPARVLEEIDPRTFANRPSLWRASYPWPRLDAHKYMRGHAVVVSGPAESTGAARLGARGALRIGAGLVTVVGPATATAVNATHLTAIMLKAVGSDTALTEFLGDVRRNAVLIGPGAGVGAATAATVLTVLASPAAAVLDADALTSFAPGESNEPVRAVGFGFVVRGSEPGPNADGLFGAIKARQGAGGAHPARGRVQAPVRRPAGIEARPHPPRRRGERRRGHPQGSRHRDRRARRPRRHQRQRPALARHRRRRRRAGRLRHRPAGAAHAGLRSRLRRRLAARRMRHANSAPASSPRTCRRRCRRC